MTVLRSPRVRPTARLISTVAFLSLSASLFAQTVAPSAAELAKYDTNKNGRLDADEQAAMRTVESQAVVQTADRPTRDEEVVQLTPFEVRESNSGYLATNTMSGTRLNSKLEDLGSSISVVTKQQMTDFAMLDINDIFAYEGGTEGTGNYTNFSVDRNGMVSDSIQGNPQGSNRIRGIGPANISVNGFTTSGRVPIDPIDVDSVEISRGPNSSIFGLGEGSGTVNLVASSANLTRETSQTQFRADSMGGWRTSIDLNRPLIKNKLALRVSGAYQHDGFERKPSGFDSRRFNAMIRAQPFKYTTLRASYQTYRGDGTRATTVTPRDGVSDWIRLGSPVWDPVTSTVTVNGVSTVMGATNPTGLADQSRPYPVILVGDQGLDIWTIGRMPAAGATNGPNNVGGVGRLLETVPEPVRDGRPLFSTLPGVSDRNIYDYANINLAAPNYLRDAVDTVTVQLEQYLLDTDAHKIALQVSWQRENAERFANNVIGSTSATGNSFYLNVDPNSRLLDGRANPYFKHLYIGVPEPVFTEQPYDRNTYRGQLAYLVDFSKYKSKWLKYLGRHQLLGYYEERKTANYVYRFRDVMISDNPIYAPAGQTKGNQSGTGVNAASPQATRAYYHYYVGDNVGNNVDGGPSNVERGNYTFTWYNPLTSAWVNDAATLGTSGITEGTAAGNASLVLVKTKGAMMQNFLFGERLVLTFGRRTDEIFTKAQNAAALMPDGYTFNYGAMEGWRPNWTTRDGETKTAGAVLKPFRDWGFIERAQAGSGLKAGIAKAVYGLSLFYNTSDSFIPQTPAWSVLRTPLPNTTSEGEDFGFAINLGNKLSFRASHYTTDQINSRNGQSASIANRLLQMDLNPFAGANRAFPLQRQATNWVRAANPSWTTTQIAAEVTKIMQFDPTWEPFYRGGNTLSETQGITAKGDEFELTYNPSSFWTLKANATRSEAIDSALSQNIFEWLAIRMPVWETIIDPRTGTKWLDTGYTGDLPDPTANTARSSWLIPNIEIPITLARATEGTARPQIREWRFNVSTSYRLAGISDNKIMKKLTVGGAVRWESKAAIGYYGVPVGGSLDAAVTLDPSRPIYDKARAYYDGFLTYNTKMFRDKIRARFQLNVRNIQESKARLQAVGAYPNGVPHTFRIIDPRTFILTATFDL